MSDVIPDPGSERMHVVLCRRGPGQRWQELGRAARDPARRLAAEMRLRLGPDNVKVRPVPEGAKAK